MSLDTSSKITVAFHHTRHHEPNKVFFQPLFYLASNIKENIKKANGDDKYNKEMDDEKLEIPHTILNMEFSQIINSSNSDETTISYILDRFKANDTFKYDNAHFNIKTVSVCKDNPINTQHGEYTIYSSYEISYNSKDFNKFENFIKDSIKYYKKFYYDENTKHDEIKISMSNGDGYFERMGSIEKRSLDTIYLPKKQKQSIIDDLTNFLKPETKARYKKLGVNYKRVYLFEGIPGSGKSSFIMALASKFNYDLAIVSFHPKMTDVDLSRILRSINSDNDNKDNDKKSFIIFEDIDCIFKSRKINDESKNNITLSGLLNIMDGIIAGQNIIFLSSNEISHLDSALIRPGRVDRIEKFDYSVKEQILEIFSVFTENEEKAINFYTELCKYNIKVSSSLLQQYLLKYQFNPDVAIENLDEIKKMYDSCNITKDGKELYN
jgi:hypothetical protein